MGRPALGGVDVDPIPGDRFTVFDPSNVAELVTALTARLREARSHVDNVRLQADAACPSGLVPPFPRRETDGTRP
jgi:hypothetical protein